MTLRKLHVPLRTGYHDVEETSLTPYSASLIKFWRQCKIKQELILLITILLTNDTIVNPMKSKLPALSYGNNERQLYLKELPLIITYIKCS